MRIHRTRTAPFLGLSGFLLLPFSPVTDAAPVFDDQTIDASTPRQSWQVIDGSLTANGATTNEIIAEPGTRVTLNDSTVAANAAGLRLLGASAVVNRSQLSSQSNQGLLMNEGSQAQVFDSQITGALRGATVNASTLELTRTQVSATAATSSGLVVLDGTLRASQGSVISGVNEGILIRSTPTGTANSVVLDASQASGQAGPAIRVGQGSAPADAQIAILNGSTLSAGAGEALIDIGDNATANVRVNASDLIGDIVAQPDGHASLTLENRATLRGRLDNIERVAIDSLASWTLVEDSQIGALSMNGGSIRFGEADGQFHTLTADSLEGNGTFVMAVDFNTLQHDYLNITGQATGDHGLLVSSSGTEPQAESQMHLVHTGSGDARFSLIGGPVDLGAYSYDLVQRDNDWFLDTSTRTVSPGTQTLLGLFNTAPTVWYGELATLRSRMGDVRRGGDTAGTWLRSYGNQYNVSSSSTTQYQQTQQGISFGADMPLGQGQWLAGVTAGYSKSDLNLPRGASGEVDSYHLGVYATWVDPQSGYYFDAVGKLNRFRNQAEVRLSDGQRAKGDFDTTGAGVSLEAGRHLKLGDGWFVEPYAQVAGLIVQGREVTLDNGMRADSQRSRSLQGKVGSALGRDIALEGGGTLQPYIKVAALHEFARGNDVKVNDNRFHNDLAGTRGEVGAGLSARWAERWQVHAEFDYSNGDKLEKPWGMSLGVNYRW